MAKDGSEQALDRKLTVQVETGGSYLELAEAVWRQLGTSAISCMQPHGPGRFQLTLSTMGFLERLVAEGLRYKDRRLTVSPLVQPYRWVLVRNAPFEMPMEEIVEALAEYGKVAEHQYEHWMIQGIKVLNGDRRFRVFMERPVPNIVRCGKYTLICTYAGVAMQCRNCGDVGHQVARCKVVTCHGCRQQGHKIAQCPAYQRPPVPPRPAPQPDAEAPAAEPRPEQGKEEVERRPNRKGVRKVPRKYDSDYPRSEPESEREPEPELESEEEPASKSYSESESESEEEPAREGSTDRDIREMKQVLDEDPPGSRLFSEVTASPPVTRSAARAQGRLSHWDRFQLNF